MIGPHGHVSPRADGVRARCGGPGICPACQREAAGLRSTRPIDPMNLATPPARIREESASSDVFAAAADVAEAAVDIAMDLLSD